MSEFEIGDTVRLKEPLRKGYSEAGVINRFNDRKDAAYIQFPDREYFLMTHFLEKVET